MKKTWRMILTCAFVYVLSFGITAIVMGIEPVRQEVVSDDITQTASVVSHQPAYIVKEYNGAVAVYLDGEALPMIETDIPVSGLRKNDRELMEQGITLNSYTEVLYLLEDFGS